MRSISAAADGDLLWTQPHALRQDYELRSGDEILATLRGQSHWAWQDSSGAPLVTFSSQRGLLRRGARVELAPGADTAPALPLPVTLGWYLLVLHNQEVTVTTG